MADTLNDMVVRNLKPQEKEYTRREQGGFGVRVYPSGRKVLFFMYRLDGKRKYLELGEYGNGSGKITLKEARAEYEAEREKVKAVKKGYPGAVDPVTERRKAREQRDEANAADTVADLAKEFLSKWVKKRKAAVSAANDERALNADVLPRWKHRKARDIRRRDAILLLEEIAERAPGTAQYVLKVCRKMFAFAMQREIVEFNPFAGITSAVPELAPKKKERNLSAEEIKTLWASLDTGPGSDEIKSILKLILVTAQRPGEVAGIRRSEVDGHWWTLPPARNKTKKEHRVYLTDLAISLLPEKSDDPDLYFPSPRIEKPREGEKPKARKPVAVNALAHAVRREDDPRKKVIKGRDGKERARHSAFFGLAPWTPHDLRRTARTFFAEIGIVRDHAEAVLNHVLPGVEGTYNRYKYDKEKQMALEAWERKLLCIIGQSEGAQIIPIQRKKA